MEIVKNSAKFFLKDGGIIKSRYSIDVQIR
jgi:hypothetical protein